MPENFAIFTTNISLIKSARDCFDGLSTCYFASDLQSFGMLMERLNPSFWCIDRSDYSSELEACFNSRNCPFSIVNTLEEIKSCVGSRNRNPVEECTGLQFTEESITSESFNGITGNSPVIQNLKSKIIKFAQSDFNVLITGETGTGKSVIANAIHELSPRRSNRIIRKNINAISDSLFESELFGHVKGAFTGAEKDHRGVLTQAQDSSLFLDEFGDLPLHLQVKLLTVIQEREYSPVGSEKTFSTNARFIFATNADLEKKVAEGTFREDLLSRIQTLKIEVPPLREHPEDIPMIADAILNRLGTFKRLSPLSKETLKRGYWKRNVRDLEDCLKLATVLCEENVISPAFLKFN